MFPKLRFRYVQVEKKASTLSQIFWLFHRESISQYRNQKFLVIRFLQSFIIPFFLAWLYYRLDEDQPSIVDRKSALYFLLSVPFLSMNSLLLSRSFYPGAKFIIESGMVKYSHLPLLIVVAIGGFLSLSVVFPVCLDNVSLLDFWS